MSRGCARGLTLLDVLVTIALLALLVWLVRLDWSLPEPPVHGATVHRTADPEADG